MLIYLSINKENRVIGCGSTRGSSSDIEVDIPSNHEVFKNPLIYKYENGQLVKDAVYQQKLINDSKAAESQPTLREELQQLKKQNADLAYSLMLKGVL